MQKEHHVIINLTQNHASLQYSSNLKRLKTTHSITKRLENIIFSHASAIISRTTKKKNYENFLSTIKWCLFLHILIYEAI